MMAASDPEDGVDQMMIQAWQALARQLSTLHGAVDRYSRQAYVSHRDRLQRQRQAELSHAQRLDRWEEQHRRELNNGFEQVLDSTVLAPGRERLSDEALMKAWVVSDQVSADPGYAKRLRDARSWMQHEWADRGHLEPLATASDLLVNQVSIRYTEPSDDLQRTVEAFRKAGVPFTTVQVDADGRREYDKAHPGVTFSVDTKLNGSWDGFDHDRIVEAVMTSPIDSGDGVEARLGFLKDQGLPESSHADNHAAGIEPSTVSETTPSEITDAAPVPVAPVEQREQRRERSAESRDDSGDLSVGSQPQPGYEGPPPVSLNEPEDWEGPDMFGQYSVGEEARLFAETTRENTAIDPLTALTPSPVLARPQSTPASGR
jgi:hypothetical protein